MGKFKFSNNVSDGWLFTNELRFFRNFIQNWKNDVEDDDFFDLFGNPNNSSCEDARRMYARHFSVKELTKVGAVHVTDDNDDDDEDDELSEIMGFAITSHITRSIQSIWNDTSLRPRCREMLLEWADVLEKRKTARRRREDPLGRRMDEVASVLKLDEIERDILTFTLVRSLTCFDDFPARETRGRSARTVFFAMALDCPVSMVDKALSADGRLMRFDVVDSDYDLCHGPFRRYLECGGKSALEGEFYRRRDVSAALPWGYFGKLAEKHGDILKRMIRSAAGKSPLNILLYGAPGTGKTSFATTLARELGMDLFEIRQGDKDGERNSPSARLAGIHMSGEQIPRGNAMILVDEADALLRTSLGFFGMAPGRSSMASEKGVMNSVLDDTVHPTVWIINAPACSMDESVRRRFDYSICFEKPSEEQRRAIWRNNVEKLRMARLVDETMLADFARRYDASAGGITMVLENVRRMKPRKGEVADLVEKLMKPHCRLMGAESPVSATRLSGDYSLEGLNIAGEVPLDAIVRAVGKFRKEVAGGEELDPDRPRMNILLYGPPGTGKTEFVKYLGRETGAKVLVKMASDLLDCYVGETEAKIRAAFEEAEAAGAILFMDEIDGLLQDRSGTRESWEVTRVNEILHRMENFKGVMVAATNFMDNLDQAVMRRFTFKLAFDWLDSTGKRLFFERMFKAPLSEAEAARLDAIPNLAPGDFRTVRQSLYYLDGTATNAMRLAGLEKESSVKKVAASTRIAGFAA